MNSALTLFCHEYQQLSSNRLEVLRDIYSPTICFEDPAHRIQGIEQLVTYFEGLFSNLTHCNFNIERVIEQEQQAFISWQMRFGHPRLNGGREIQTPGASYLQFDEKITLHRDYFDLGATLYEHVPVVGYAVKLLKRRLNT